MKNRVLGVVTAVACIGLAGGAAAIELSTHRAVYTMRLLETRGGSDLADVRGHMLLEWSDTCDGWTVNQKVLMNYYPRTGENFENNFTFSSWESKDGSVFRFSLRTATGGEVIEETDGRADLSEPGRDGRAAFESPEPATLDLPPGTMFPTEHLFYTVDRAAAGERMFSRNVFSGTGEDSLNYVFATVGPELAPGSRPLIGGTERDANILALAERTSWQVDLGYFTMDQSEMLPEFEVHYRLVDNGVAAHLDLDYGTFAIRATLDRLEILPVPDC